MHLNIKYLLTFQVLKLYLKKENERNWCLKMAQHLFSQLSHSKEYNIDNKYERGSTTKVCPCQAKEVLFGKLCDTSFGKT
jgi:hypothetical protein